jgi:hypothetical protein
MGITFARETFLPFELVDCRFSLMQPLDKNYGL